MMPLRVVLSGVDCFDYWCILSSYFSFLKFFEECYWDFDRSCIESVDLFC